MTSDFRPTRDLLQQLIEEYGSKMHAALDLGIERAELEAWLSGTKPIPPGFYDRLLTLLAAWRRK